MTKWEYEAYSLRDFKLLNEMGKEGWGLVAILCYSEYHYPEVYFKRPLEEK